MAVKHTVVTECDQHTNDQPKRGEFKTIRFELDGTAYETELCAEHLAPFNDMIGAWIGNARKIPRGPARRGQADGSANWERLRSAVDREQTRQMRAWLLQHGRPISRRGRIPQAEIAYYQEHAATA
jgi:Lsr2